jgi:kumamolisin
MIMREHAMNRHLIFAFLPLAVLILLSSISVSFAREDIHVYWDPFRQERAEIYSANNSAPFGDNGSIEDALDISHKNDDLFTANPVQFKDIQSEEGSATDDLKPLTGSRREPVKGAKTLGPLNPDELIAITLIVRSNSIGAQFAAVESANNVMNKSAGNRGYLSRQEFAKVNAPSQNTIAKIRNFALSRGLTIDQIGPDGGIIVLSGTSQELDNAFGIKLMNYDSPEGAYRGYTGDLKVPSDIAPLILGVFGLDNRKIAHPYFISAEKSSRITYTPQQIAKLYDFPQGLDGTGQCIALIELGGGYEIGDIENYFRWLKIRAPEIALIPVDNTVGARGTDDDGEVLLDIDMAGGVAPGAKIAVYMAPNSEQGFIDAVNAAVHDAANRPSVISISWGATECSCTLGFMEAMDQVMQSAAVMGVTVFCASGDDGSSDGMRDNRSHVDYPASSRFTTGCGGTRFDPTGEVVWNEGINNSTGGGISDVFPMPLWQDNARIPASANPGGHIGRGVPDLAGNADPYTGYLLLFRGKPVVFGGTSAVAPLYAGLTALIDQRLDRPVGFLNPSLYALAYSRVFNDITSGDNGAYQAIKGWDACTGLGSLDGSNLLQALNR